MGHTFDPDNIYHEAERLRATNVILKADLREAEAALAVAEKFIKVVDDTAPGMVPDRINLAFDAYQLARQAEKGGE